MSLLQNMHKRCTDLLLGLKQPVFIAVDVATARPHVPTIHNRKMENQRIALDGVIALIVALVLELLFLLALLFLILALILVLPRPLQHAVRVESDVAVGIRTAK